MSRKSKAYHEFQERVYHQRGRLQPERACRVCGCTQQRACEGGCSWVGWDLCSRCDPRTRAALDAVREDAASGGAA